MMRVLVKSDSIINICVTPTGTIEFTLWIETEKGEIGIQGLSKQQAEVLVVTFNAALGL